jgi:hypothetical protein
MRRRRSVLRESGFVSDPKHGISLGFPPPSLGQRYPQDCPQPEDAMGAPLPIGEAARLIGCSPWTIRQTLMPRGLPYFRSGRGKLIFYTNQIVGWIKDQQKGVL